MPKFYYANQPGRKTFSCQILRSGISVHWLIAAELISSNAASLACEPARVIACSLVMPDCKPAYRVRALNTRVKLRGINKVVDDGN